MEGEKFIIANELADQIADTCIPNEVAQRLARLLYVQEVRHYCKLTLS